jgi:GDPmannose 4,6-dehydratase
LAIRAKKLGLLPANSQLSSFDLSAFQGKLPFLRGRQGMQEGRGMAKRVLITGITGQDGAYLARVLLQKGGEVFGGERRSSSCNRARLVELGIEKDIRLVDFDLMEFSNILHVLEQVAPDEVYNLAAQSFVQTSFELPIYTGDCNGIGVTRMLEAIRTLGGKPRFYQASTSEMFGNAIESPQNENTPFRPRSPYGISKLYAHWTTVNYREAHGLHASCGILFNHESPLRGQEFVTRKITLGLARVKQQEQDVVELGNLDAERDWGFADDYVVGIHKMLQQEVPDDYVLATGQARSVREFIKLAGRAMGFDIQFDGRGVDERGIDRISGREVVRVNEKFYRPAEVHRLLGNPAKAKAKLGWAPQVSFEAMVAMMAEADLRRVRDNRCEF